MSTDDYRQDGPFDDMTPEEFRLFRLNSIREDLARIARGEPKKTLTLDDLVAREVPRQEKPAKVKFAKPEDIQRRDLDYNELLLEAATSVLAEKRGRAGAAKRRLTPRPLLQPDKIEWAVIEEHERDENQSDGQIANRVWGNKGLNVISRRVNRIRERYRLGKYDLKKRPRKRLKKLQKASTKERF